MSGTGSPSCGPAPDSACAMSAARPVRVPGAVLVDCCRAPAGRVLTSDGFCCVPRVPLGVRCGGTGQLSAERIWSVVSTEPVDGVTAGGVTVDCATVDRGTVDS